MLSRARRRWCWRPLALEVEVAVEQGIEAGMESGAEFLGAACAAPLPCDPSITRYSPWVAVPPAGTWACGPWVATGWKLAPTTNCAHVCIYTRTNTRIEQRTAARWNATCTGYINWTQTRTVAFDQTAECTRDTVIPELDPIRRPYCVTVSNCPPQPVSAQYPQQFSCTLPQSCEPSATDTITETAGPSPVDPPPAP